MASSILHHEVGRTWPWIAVLAAAILGTVLAVASGIAYVVPYWEQPEYSHQWLIPPLALLILWWRRKLILAERSAGSWLGLALLAVSVACTLLGAVTGFSRLQAGILPLLLAGLGLATLGWGGMRLVWVPLLFLLFALPLPAAIYTPLSLQLQLLSSQLGAGFLDLVGVSVYLDGNVIDLGIFQLQVAEACNGLRYLFPLAAFGFLCAWLYRAPFWARTLLLLSTVPITIVMNSLRIGLTGLIVDYGDPALADGFLHLFEGWIVFVAALAVMAALMWLLARLAGWRGGFLDLLDFDRLHGRPAAVHRPAPSIDVPRPLLASTALLLAVALSQNAIGTRVETPPDRPGLVGFPLQVEAWRGQADQPDAAALEALGLDDYVLANYSEDGRHVVNLWIAYYASQRGAVVPHSPSACLPGAGWELTRQSTVPTPSGIEPSFDVNRGVFTRGAERLLVYYWLEQRGRQLASWTPLKWLTIWDLLTKGRTDGALVRLVTPIGLDETEAEAEARLQRYLVAVYPRLGPYVGR